MLNPRFTIRDDFPPVGYERWQEAARASLKTKQLDELITHTYEQIDVRPLYFGPEGQTAPVDGRRAPAWDLCQEHDHPDLTTTHQAILADVGGGVDSVQLRLDNSAQRGLDPDDDRVGQSSTRGLPLFHIDDFDAILNGVEMREVAVALDARAAFLPAAAVLIALWRRQGISLDDVQGAFGADPISALVQSPELPTSSEKLLSQMAELAAWTAGHCPRCTSVAVDTSAYHQAGATETQDLGFAMATGVEYLRAMNAAGMSVDSSAAQFSFRFCLGTDHFQAITKLRAARILWSRVVEACGGRPNTAARIQTRTSDRVLTTRDPHTNLMRNTTAVFAAALGGADVITSVPFDHAIGLPDEFSRRIARNTASILQQEAQLHHVADPAAGSWFLEELTLDVAAQAWSIFQEVERQGGMLAAIRNGWVRQQLDLSHAAMLRDLADGKRGIVGVTEFADDRERPQPPRIPDMPSLRQYAAQRIAGLRPAIGLSPLTDGEGDRVSKLIEAAANGYSIGQLSRSLGFFANACERAEPLPQRRLAESFETGGAIQP